MMADAAQIANEKLYVMGGGWTWTDPQIAGHAVAGYIDLEPGDRLRGRLHWMLRLLDDHEGLHTVPTTNGEAPFILEGDLHMDPVSGDSGSVRLPVAFGFGPLTLEAGRSYAWELVLNDQTDPAWRVEFHTRAAD